MKESGAGNPNLEFAEAIRSACIQAAVEGYENAATSGLCAEGAFEAAVSAVRMLDLRTVIERENAGDR